MVSAVVATERSSAVVFCAMNNPPIFTSGRVYSSTVENCATARAVAMSKVSRYCACWPTSSARKDSTDTFVRCNVSAVACIKRAFFCTDSIHVTCTWLCTMAIGSAGKPAPLPTSTSVFACGGICGSRVQLSRKCLSFIS